jgi:hypothetical protein
VSGRFDELVDLIAHHRAQFERAFDGELLRLETIHGSRAIDEAVRLARQRDQVSISRERQRQQRTIANERRVQDARQRRPHAEESPRPLRPDPSIPLPPGWR